MRVEMLNASCDRCQKVVPVCHPFKLAVSIVFRGRTIEHPWLCPTCIMQEKKKWWKAKEVA